MTVPFEKWEGLGNDFVLVEGAPASPAWVRRVCDRRLGVGADGVLFVEGARSGALRMTVVNADGSRPEMCGNGIRCVAGFVAGIRLTSNDRLEIATDAGLRTCDVEVRGEGEVSAVVDMGIAKVLDERAFEIDGERHRFTLADVGNPHAVTFAPFADGDVDRIAPRVSALTPAGSNVEFCRISAGRVDVIVWERGVGRTLACGTGACAVAAVTCASGRASFDAPLTVGLPGGDLTITIARASGRAIMRGPARRVFRGEVAF